MRLKAHPHMPPKPSTLAAKAVYWAIDYGFMTTGHLQVLRAPFAMRRLRNPGGRPVLIIPGIFEGRYFVLPLAIKLARLGYDVHLLPVRIKAVNTIAENGDMVHRYVTEHDLHDVVIVGHSKGALDELDYIDRYGDDGRVSMLIAVAGPFNGTSLARYDPTKLLKDFLPDGETVKRMARLAAGRTDIISIAPAWDNHIWSPLGSTLADARNIELPIFGHHRIVFSAILADTIAALIT